MITCKNCQHQFEGKFCPNCGQKVIDRRFKLIDSIKWLFSSIFNLEQGFFYTTREMITQPGVVVRNFIDGNTRKYAHPFRFVFIWASLSAIIGVYFNVFEESGMMFNRMMGQSEKQLEFAHKIMLRMKQYMSFVIMAMIPFIALGSYIVTKRKKFNYAEHLVLMAYSNGISIVIGIPIMFLYSYVEDTSWLTSFSLLIGVIVIGRVFSKTMNDNLLMGMIKYFFSFLLGLIIQTVFLFIALIVIVKVFQFAGLSNPFR